MQKRAVFYVYVIFWEQSGQAGVENGAMLNTYLFRYTAPLCSQIFKIFFVSGGKGALTPLTKILRTFLVKPWALPIPSHMVKHREYRSRYAVATLDHHVVHWDARIHPIRIQTGRRTRQTHQASVFAFTFSRHLSIHWCTYVSAVLFGSFSTLSNDWQRTESIYEKIDCVYSWT